MCLPSPPRGPEREATQLLSCMHYRIGVIDVSLSTLLVVSVRASFRLFRMDATKRQVTLSFLECVLIARSTGSGWRTIGRESLDCRRTAKITTVPAEGPALETLPRGVANARTGFLAQFDPSSARTVAGLKDGWSSEGADAVADFANESVVFEDSFEGIGGDGSQIGAVSLASDGRQRPDHHVGVGGIERSPCGVSVPSQFGPDGGQALLLSALACSEAEGD